MFTEQAQTGEPPKEEDPRAEEIEAVQRALERVEGTSPRQLLLKKLWRLRQRRNGHSAKARKTGGKTRHASRARSQSV